MLWRYVLADAAVSGTLTCRRGYTLAKLLFERRNESGVAWFLMDDLSRMSRNTIESLRLGELAEATGVRVVGASDGFDSANVGYRLVDVKDACGNLMLTHKNTIEKAVEIDPEAADWTRRGAEMIAYEGRSATDVARLFNEHNVGASRHGPTAGFGSITAARNSSAKTCDTRAGRSPSARPAKRR